jgi:hypothetical protein
MPSPNSDPAEESRRDAAPGSPADLPVGVLRALRGRVAGVQAQPGFYQAAVMLSRHDALELIRVLYPEEPGTPRFIGDDE